MNRELFVQTMKHFIHVTQSSIENPTCLIMDNHESHLSIETLDLAKKNGVTILTLPPHCSHRLQPLDVSIFGPFKAHYNSAVQAWLLNHPGIPLSLYDIGYCVRIAHERSMTPANIRSGFQKTGIFPFDRNIFSDEDFLCSAVTDRPQNSGPSQKSNEADDDVVTGVTEPGASSSHMNVSDASTSYMNVTVPEPSENTNSQKSAFQSPTEFRGFPKARERVGGRSRVKGRSMIATDTPEKTELEEKALARNKNLKKKTSTVKRMVLDSPDSPKSAKKSKLVKQTKKETVSSSDSSGDELPNFSKCTNSSSDDDDDENWIPEPQPSGFEELSRRPEQDDYVLVEFKTAGKKSVYYVAKILEVLKDDEFCVTYLRKSEKMTGKFIPGDEKNYNIGIEDIKLLLPQPQNFGATKRQQSHLCFEIDFGAVDVR